MPAGVVASTVFVLQTVRTTALPWTTARTRARYLTVLNAVVGAVAGVWHAVGFVVAIANCWR